MRQLLSTLVLLLFVFSINAQTNSSLDELFEEWDNPERPGVAAIILNKGEIIYSTALGSANLENAVPITLDTKFQLAGLSKHFVAFATLLLEEDGKISLEDDVRKYIPELPVFSHTIRIKHLLSHSSGLNDYWELKNLLGWREADTFTHQDAMKLILSQSSLAYTPGENFIYGNTEQTLLAEIVMRVSMQSLSAFMQARVFGPLDMTNTVYKEQLNQPISNAAIAYRETENGFRKVISNFANAGPTNLYSSVNDLAKWELNLSSTTPSVGNRAMFNRLNAAATLSDGSTMDPAFGRFTIGQQLLHYERGLLNIYQTGNLGGYTSSIFKFINEEFTVIVLSNAGVPYTGYLGMRSAYQYLSDQFKAPEAVDFENLPTKNLNRQELLAYEGHYWNDRASYSREIVLINDTLRYSRGPGNSSPILPLGNGKFQMFSEGDESIFVDFSKENKQRTMDVTIGGSAPIPSKAYIPVDYTPSQLENFSGTYYAKELSLVFEFMVEEGVLKAKNLRTGTTNFRPISEDLFSGDQWALSGIRFMRNDNNMITGFELNTEQIKKIWFERM